MLKWAIIGLSLLMYGQVSAQRNLALHDTFPVFQMQTLSGETYSNDSALQYPTIYVFGHRGMRLHWSYWMKSNSIIPLSTQPEEV